MRVIAILDRSAGNDSVGEMWQETRSFEATDMLHTVLVWATQQAKCRAPQDFRGNLRITIDQAAQDE